MSIYNIELNKTNEDDQTVSYRFKDADHQDTGELCLYKASGEIDLLREPSDDKNQNVTMRAARRLRRLWESGNYPTKASWQS